MPQFNDTIITIYCFISSFILTTLAIVVLRKFVTQFKDRISKSDRIIMGVNEVQDELTESTIRIIEYLRKIEKKINTQEKVKK